MRLLIASVLMRNGRYGEAITEYDQVIEKDAARPAAYVERAQAYAMSGDYKKATQRVYHTPGQASLIELPVVEKE